MLSIVLQNVLSIIDSVLDFIIMCLGMGLWVIFFKSLLTTLGYCIKIKDSDTLLIMARSWLSYLQILVYHHFLYTFLLQLLLVLCWSFWMSSFMFLNISINICLFPFFELNPRHFLHLMFALVQVSVISVIPVGSSFELLF